MVKVVGMGGFLIVYLDLFSSILVAFILFCLIEKKFKGKERFLGYYLLAILLFILSR